MLTIAIAAYCIYFLINIYTSFMQIDYVKKAKQKDAVYTYTVKVCHSR